MGNLLDAYQGMFRMKKERKKYGPHGYKKYSLHHKYLKKHKQMLNGVLIKLMEEKKRKKEREKPRDRSGLPPCPLYHIC